MINEIRTRLMNVNGQVGFRADVPGEEFIPPTFRARVLHPRVKLGWQTLFGKSPDRLFLNYRLYQLMTLLHESELADYVTLPDNRITYWPRKDPGFFEDTWGVVPQQIAGPETDFYTLRQPQANSEAGRCQWDLSHTQAAGTVGDLAEITTLAAGLQIQTRLQAAECRWLIQARAKPTADLGQILANFVAALGNGLAWIFRPVLASPYDTLYQLYNDHPHALIRYGAVVLGLAFRMEEMEQA